MSLLKFAQFTLLLLTFAAFGFCTTVKELHGEEEANVLGLNNVHRSDLIDHLLLRSRYDRSVKPNFDQGKPTAVKVSIYVQSFDTISAVSLDYKITVFARQKWIDPRLKFDPKIINNETILTVDNIKHHLVWLPDLYFPNSKFAHGHNVMSPNSMLLIRYDGEVYYSSRISLLVACVMQLQYFPMDTQNCELQIGSYGYQTSQLNFFWDDILFEKSIHPPQYNLLGFFRSRCKEEYSTGNYSCIKVTFVMARQVGFYILQVYIPSVLLVIVSWLNFWITHEAVPARISVCLLTVLTITSQANGIRSSLPPVSYTKAIDIWMCACLLFVFAALLEFALVNSLARLSEMNAKRNRQRLLRLGKKMCAAANSESDIEANSPDIGVMLNSTMPLHKRIRHGKFYVRAHHVIKVDQISRWAFPCCFSLFNVIYWGICLSQKLEIPNKFEQLTDGSHSN